MFLSKVQLEEKAQLEKEKESRTQQILEFLKDHSPLQCECCDKVIAFTEKSTGKIVCWPGCLGERPEVHLISKDAKNPNEEVTVAKDMKVLAKSIKEEYQSGPGGVADMKESTDNSALH